jgi:hypothetical protein
MSHSNSSGFTRAAAAVAFALFLAACGSGGTPTTPTTPPANNPPPTPANTWSAAGQIVALGTAQGVGGATVTPGWSLSPVTADGQGNYQLGDVANPPSTPYPVTVSGAGMVSHDVWITWARGPRADVNLNLIRNAAPFSMDFYRQFVRGTYDQPGAPWPVLRWMTAPSFYEDDGSKRQGDRAEVPVRVLDAIEPQSRPHARRLQRRGDRDGHRPAPQAQNWINVDIRRNPAENRYAARR